MCRMLAIIPRNGSRVNPELVTAFRKLATCGMVTPGSKPGHSDGWGIVTWINAVPTYLGREPKDAMKDEKYELACKRIAELEQSSPLVVHLRKASVGLKVVSNTHPFVNSDWAFAHNGTIRKLNVKKSTDSEWFFECLMREYKRFKGDMVRAIQEQVIAVHAAYPYTSMTFILSNGKETYVYRDCSKNPSYYGMYFAEVNNLLVVCQERFFESSWQEVPNGQLLQIDSAGNHKIVSLVSSIPASS